MSLSVMLQQLASGMVVSVEIFVVTLLFSLPLGLLICFGRMSKNPAIRGIVSAYISVMRGTPLMLQLMVVYFGPYFIFGIRISMGYSLIAVFIAFSINYAAYFAEIYRGGIESISAGQYEAAKILGYSKAQTFFRIILPQVIKRILPSVTNEVITLVKDTRKYLPIDPEKQKRVFLVYVGSTPTSKGYSGDPTKQVVIEELQRAGFEVDVCPNYHDLEVENGVSPMNFIRMLHQGTRAEFVTNHDFALLVINVKGYAQENNVRVRWSINHSCELPWYNEEVPTIGMSLNYTNHLIDVPQLHTFINAYAPERMHIRAAIEKMTGKSAFKGKANELVFCGRWDTKL